MTVINIRPSCLCCKNPAIVIDTDLGDCYCTRHFVEQQASPEPLTYFRSVA